MLWTITNNYGVGSRVYSRRLDLNISLWLPNYWSVFQVEVMAIYRAAQWSQAAMVFVERWQGWSISSGILFNGLDMPLTSFILQGRQSILDQQRIAEYAERIRLSFNNFWGSYALLMSMPISCEMQILVICSFDPRQLNAAIVHRCQGYNLVY